MNDARRLALPVALVLSGLGALGVEVLWQRLLTRMLGGSTNALTAVLIAYMGGLALGAAIAGRRGDRLDRRTSLLAYVRLELAIWVTVSVVTLVLAGVPTGLGGWLAGLPEGPVRFLARFAVASLLLMIPTTAMGATLPFAIRAVVGGQGQRLLTSTGFLYAANTLGAALGALAAPIVLMPLLGVRNAALACALGNLLAALVAVVYRPEPQREDAVPEAPADEAAPAAIAHAPVLWVAVTSFTVGLAALGLQVLWTRWLTMWAGSSVQGFGTVLAVVLLGIVLGSAVVSALGRRLDDEAPAACAILAVFGGAAAVLLAPVIDAAPARLGQLAAAGALTSGSVQMLLVQLSIAVVLLPTVCFGAVLPIAVRAARKTVGASAAAVGRIYATNTIGALCGAAGTGLLLVPTLGLSRSVRVLCVLPILAGTALLLVESRRRGRSLALGLALGAAGVAALVGARLPSPYAAAARGFIPREGPTTLGRVLYHGEGPEASVLVEATPARRTFYVNGRPEASDGWSDTRVQYLIGHLPAMMGGGASRSLVIGLGAGMTAGALTRWGDVSIAELNRAVPGATRQFSDYNHQVLDKARIRIEDGRVVVALPEQYDLVTTDPIHPGVAGCASLFTTEHLRLCRSRLTPGGTVSLWVPLYQMGPEEAKALMGSFLDVYPDAELYLNTDGQSILVGGGPARTATGSLDRLRAGWSRKGVAEDMLVARLESPEAIHVMRVAGPDELRRWIGDARRNLDDDPWIELSLTRHLYRPTAPEIVESLLALRTASEREDPRVRAYEALQRSYLDSGNENVVRLLEGTLVDGRSPTLEHAMRLREASAGLALDWARGGRTEEALALARTEIAHPDGTIDSVFAARAAVEALGSEADVDAADGRLVGQWPDRPEGHYSSARTSLRRGRFADAIAHLERAKAIPGRPGYEPLVLGTLGTAELMSGATEPGLAHLRESLELNPRQPDVRKLLNASPEVLAAVREGFGAATSPGE